MNEMNVLQICPRGTVRLLCAALLGLVCATACRETSHTVQPDPPRPVAISIAPDSATLASIGNEATFEATVTDQHGTAFAGTVTWTGDAPAVFSVTQEGIVTAIANGSGMVTASLSGLSATARVTVRQVAASIAEVSGGGQVALPGTRLRDPVVVRVLDGGGTPAAHAKIRFEPAESHGTARPDSAVTGVAGEAATLWTLGTEIGPKLLTVRVPDGPTAWITATASVGSAIEVVAGDRQSGRVGSTLRDPVVVRVLDLHGNPFPGTSVRFKVERGSGAVTPDAVVTGKAGEAAALWTLGDSAGIQLLNAEVPSGPGVRMEARALTGIGICDRTEQVRWMILQALGRGDCADVTAEDLAGIMRLHNQSALPSLWAGDFRGLTGLESLALGHSDFTTLPSGVFSDLPSLRHLSLSNNRIETLPVDVFAGLARLETLGMTGNPIVALPDGIFVDLTGLRVLHLVADYDSPGQAVALRARCPEPPFGNGAPPLRHAFPPHSGHGAASAAHNPLDETACGVRTPDAGQLAVSRSGPLSPEILSGLTALDTLVIGGWFDEIPSDAFSDLSSLRFLGVPHRNYSTLLNPPPPLAHLADRAFAGLTRLEHLDLGAQLRSFPTRALSELTSLQRLSIRMPLRHLVASDIPQLTNLRSLTIAGTEIESLPGNVFAGRDLRFIGLLYNRNLTLHSDAFAGLADLDYIQLRHNGIAALPQGIFSGLGRVRYLFLDSNGLSSLPDDMFSELVNLEQLAIHEGLTELPPRALFDLPRLEFFWLESDGFSGFSPIELSSDLFSRNPKLRYVIVRNALTGLPRGLFAGRFGLERLALSGNRIPSLPPGTFVGLANLVNLQLCRNTGTPFSLPLLLKRTDTDDLAAAGPATMQVSLSIGAPFAMSIDISAPGGTVSPSVVTMAKGDSTSGSFTVVRKANQTGSVAVRIGRVPETPVASCDLSRGSIRGVRVKLGDPVTLFR